MTEKKMLMRTIMTHEDAHEDGGCERPEGKAASYVSDLSYVL